MINVVPARPALNSLSSLSDSPLEVPQNWETLEDLQIWLNKLVERIISGDRISREAALALTKIEDQEQILLLCQAADQVRQACCGNTVDLCSIVNIKSGNCSENCGFCSQSVHHPGEASPI